MFEPHTICWAIWIMNNKYVQLKLGNTITLIPDPSALCVCMVLQMFMYFSSLLTHHLTGQQWHSTIWACARGQYDTTIRLNWTSYQIFKLRGGGLTGSHFWEGVAGWERGSWLFSGGLQFFNKKRTKIWNI